MLKNSAFSYSKKYFKYGLWSFGAYWARCYFDAWNSPIQEDQKKLRSLLLHFHYIYKKEIHYDKTQSVIKFQNIFLYDSFGSIGLNFDCCSYGVSV